MYLLKRLLTKNGILWGEDIEIKPTIAKCEERALYIFKYYKDTWACPFKVEYVAIHVDEENKTAEYAWEKTFEFAPKEARCIN